MFLKHRRVFLRIFSVVRERKRSTKIVIIVPPPTYPQNFSTSIFFWNTESFPYDGFWYCETSTFRRTVVMSPISFILKIFSMLAVFRNIEGTIYKVFQHCEKKDFQRSLVISPSYAKNVSIPEILWNKRGFPYEIFQYCETKTLTKSRDTPPSSLIQKIFDTRIFLKHRRVPPRKLWALRDKKLLAQKDNILFLCVEFFGNRFFFRKTQGFPCESFRDCETKLWHKIVIQPPLLLSIKFFDTQSFLKRTRVPLRNFLTLWDKKLSKEIVLSPSYA